MDRRKLLLVVAVIVALLGAGLVFVYAKGADSRAADQYDSVEVLVATGTIATGESIEDAAANAKIGKQRLPRTAVLPSALTTTDQLNGQAANTVIYPGEQIVPEKFGGVGEASILPIPDGKVAVSVQLSDAARVAGFVQAGSEVSIWLTGTLPDDEDQEKFTRLVLPRVQVLAAGSTSLVSTTTSEEDGGTSTEQLPKQLLTLAVDQEEAEKVQFAASIGDLSFGLLNSKSKVRPGDGADSKNLFR